MLFVERAPGPAAGQAREVEIPVHAQEACADFFSVFDQAVRRIRIAANGAVPFTINAGLFAPDGFPVRSQPLGVIDAAAADNGYVRVPGAHRVPPPAESDLEGGEL